MMIPILWTVFSFAGCLSVTGDKVTAKDLARVAPEFGALPENASIGFAPLPGAHRSFSGGEIQRIAGEYGIKTGFRDWVCFEWPMQRLERTELLKAMRTTLGSDGVEIEEYSLFPAPPGEVVFPIAGLTQQPASSMWRGYVQYSSDKRFNIWARVRLDPSVAATARADVVGGTRVTVVVRSGGAELKLDGTAITSGSKGQTVTIRNPRSGKSFAAEVTGKDSVFVEALVLQGEIEK